MSVHQCPKCELRFNHKTELDDHCWHDHPEFRHDYPAAVIPPEAAAVVEEHPVQPHERVGLGESLLRWVVPARRRD